MMFDIKKDESVKIPFINRDTNIRKPVMLFEQEPFPNRDNYGCYLPLIDNGFMTINTADINMSNFNYHLTCVLNIMKDGIELESLCSSKINVIFTDGIDVNLTIFDYFFNLLFWRMVIPLGGAIESDLLFFEDAITVNSICNYVNPKIIYRYRDILNNIDGTNPFDVNLLLNNAIDDSLTLFDNIDTFSYFLANTINLEDNLDLMKTYPRFREIIFADLSNIPIEDVKDEGMRMTNEAIDYMMNSNHCLSDSFRAKQGINPRQYKEFSVNIGSKPDGSGGIFANIINKSFISGGVGDVKSLYMESHSGRTAQIISKCNVGDSGHFARILGLNNRDTILRNDPEYDCGSKNYEIINIRNSNFLYMFENRYYRLNPNGMEARLSCRDTHLIGKDIYLRSPMTCASHSKGHGVCYKCYGDLAYTNAILNIGQLASEIMSSQLTQKLLSAKHLLESKVSKIEWTPQFYDFFEIELNIINLIDGFYYAGYKLLIDPDNISVESEEDDFEYNEYVTYFEVQCPDGSIHPIHTASQDPIYITQDLNEIIQKNLETTTGDDKVEIDMETLKNRNLFLIYITNNELSKTLNLIKAIINKKSVTSSFDRNGILQKFVETILEGDLSITAIHLEIILSNLLRDPQNILLKPDWDCKDAEYQLVSLNSALINNPSITVSMEYQKLSKALYNPLSFKKTRPSFLDLLFMKSPQQYMVNSDLIDRDWVPLTDKDEPTDLMVPLN